MRAGSSDMTTENCIWKASVGEWNIEEAYMQRSISTPISKGLAVLTPLLLLCALTASTLLDRYRTMAPFGVS